MREVTADADPLIEGLQRRPGVVRLLVVEGDVSVDVVADCLNAVPSGGRLTEEVPRGLRQAIGVAISAAEQEDQRFLWQVRNRNLLCVGNDDVREATVVDDRVRPDARAAGGRNDAGAPVAEVVAIAQPSGPVAR